MKCLCDVMPLRTVSLTCDPMRTAPENSKIAQMITACHSLRVLDPTEVAKDCANVERGEVRGE